MLTKYMVFDLETQNHPHLKRVASPFCPENFIVLTGWKLYNQDRCGWKYSRTPEADMSLVIPDDVQVLVGFNIKFDLLWIWNTPELQAFFKRGGRIWDCQYAEYLLQAQHETWHMPALNAVSKLYGGSQKPDAVKAMWENGVLTADIPEDILVDYAVGTEAENRLGGDVHNTELCFLGQLEKATRFKMLHSIVERMEGLLATTMMEYNGLVINVEAAYSRLEELTQAYNELNKTLEQYLPEFPEDAYSMTENIPLQMLWTSPVWVSALVFGGAVKYRKRVQKMHNGEPVWKTAEVVMPVFSGVPVHPDKTTLGHDGCRYYAGQPQDVYKSGKRALDGIFKKVKVTLEEPVTVWQEFIFDLPGFIHRDRVLAGKAPTGGWIANSLTDARGVPLMRCGTESLAILGSYDVPFCKALAQLSALEKEIGTYYLKTDARGNKSGMLTCVDAVTNRIHHKLNHCSTVTTRLSSSDPNLQNLPRGDKSRVKEMFVSRFGDDGRMIEMDYSQLEVLGLAVLSKDKHLLEDILNGVDFHCKRVALKNGIEYDEAVYLCKEEDAPDHSRWSRERTLCKTFSFQRQYGAGAAAIARETGMSKEDVEKLIAIEEAAYPGVKAFNDAVQNAVEGSARPFRDHIRGGCYRRGYWHAPTGTLYTWRSYDAPDFMRQRGISDTFSPPELKNYPVQGTSGEFVQCVLGELFRLFINSSNYNGLAYLVNTVHDCVWVDVHKSVVDIVVKDVRTVMESVPELFNTRYNMNITIPFKVSVEVGTDMYNLTKYIKGEQHE